MRDAREQNQGAIILPDMGMTDIMIHEVVDPFPLLQPLLSLRVSRAGVTTDQDILYQIISIVDLTITPARVHPGQQDIEGEYLKKISALFVPVRCHQGVQMVVKRQGKSISALA